jgi:hypothetical protein
MCAAGYARPMRHGSGICLVGFFFLLLATAAQASDTIELVRECEGREPIAQAPEFGIGMCLDYLSGMLDMHSLMSDPRIGNGRAQFCLPEKGISNEQAIKVFLKWADDNPAELHKSARISVLRALREAFPCSK